LTEIVSVVYIWWVVGICSLIGVWQLVKGLGSSVVIGPAGSDCSWVFGAQVKEQYQKSYDHFVAVQQRIQELGPAPTKAPELSAVSRGQRAIDVRKMEQVALRNRIALQIVHQAGPGDNLRVSFEFSQHPCFPVAVVKKS
jgi:hypothetical protein